MQTIDPYPRNSLTRNSLVNIYSPPAACLPRGHLVRFSASLLPVVFVRPPLRLPQKTKIRPRFPCRRPSPAHPPWRLTRLGTLDQGITPSAERVAAGQDGGGRRPTVAYLCGGCVEFDQQQASGRREGCAPNSCMYSRRGRC